MKLIKYNPEKRKELIEEIVDYLKEGKVIVLPTDTVYGLVADATNEKAVRKVFQIKKRKKEKALSVFIKNIESAKDYAIVGSSQESFLDEVWPGKVTAILRRKEKCSLPAILFGKENTIGFRIPGCELIYEIIDIFKKPLTGTSANISGNSSSVKIDRVIKQFENQKYQPDLVIDVGDLEISKPSTVIDLTRPEPRVLRIGSALRKKEE
jgi:L-threonylcarbamoyladenylate synthase